MKGLFLYEQPIDPVNPSGVDKKVLAQLKAFHQAGLDCELHVFADVEQSGRGAMEALLRRLPFTNRVPSWHYDPLYVRMDFLYFRKPAYLTQPMRRVLGKVKAHNPNIRIIMEIPTYPYDSEIVRNWMDWPLLWKDRYNRKRLSKVIDALAVVCEEPLEELFGVPAIRMINGIDPDAISLRTPIVDDTIDLLCVALFNKWHGYERLLNGLIDYYQQGGERKFKVHMVGEGPELPEYKQIAEHAALLNKVFFYGCLSGEALDHVYDLSDMGVCSLGGYKRGTNYSAELKSREYLMKGLPMVTGCPIDILDEYAEGFFLQFSNGPQSIDMDRVVVFYDSMRARAYNSEAIARAMRAFAVERASMAEAMKPVVVALAAGEPVFAEA